MFDENLVKEENKEGSLNFLREMGKSPSFQEGREISLNF